MAYLFIGAETGPDEFAVVDEKAANANGAANGKGNETGGDANEALGGERSMWGSGRRTVD